MTLPWSKLEAKMNYKVLAYCSLFVLIAFVSCDSDGDEPKIEQNAFDRTALLTSWADHMIIPALEAYVTSVENLSDRQVAFFNNPDLAGLSDLRAGWLDSYKTWQRVSMFEIGRAEEMGLRNSTNIYPADTDLIEGNIAAQDYKLALPSNYSAQGFPALDYLYFGLASSDEELIGILSTPSYQNYATDLLDRLESLARGVRNDWDTGYREEFIQNNGASATASVDKVVNDFLFYYEKFLRAGKIGIPAGVFSGSPLSETVEAPFANVYSKELFMVAFAAVQDFFEGVGFDGTRRPNSILEYIATSQQDDSRDLGQEILMQWSKAEDAVALISDSFKEQVESDNAVMLRAYDELQKAVILLKVDMMQTLNIQVDFVDADGD